MNILACFVLLYVCLLQAHIGIAKCSLALGDLSTANDAISVIKELNPNNSATSPVVQLVEGIRRLNEFAIEAYLEEDYGEVIMFCEIFVL
jgi:hypothetical protein